MLRKTNLSLFLSYDDFLTLNKKRNKIYTEATPYIEQTIFRLNAMYAKNLHNKSCEKAKQIYYNYLKYNTNYHSCKKIVYYATESKVIDQMEFAMTHQEYVEFTEMHLQKYGCKTVHEYEQLIKQSYDNMKNIMENHRLLDKFTNELNEYVKLHEKFMIQESSFDKRIVELVRRKMRTEEHLVKYQQKRSQYLKMHNPYGI